MSSVATPTIRFEGAVPQFTVSDVVRTAEYYRDVLGFQMAGYWDGERVSFATDPPPVFAIVWRDQVQVFFSRADQPDVRTGRAEDASDAYLRVIGIDALAEELRTRGADILDGPEDRIYGQRELVVKDCNGLILCFGEPYQWRIAMANIQKRVHILEAYAVISLLAFGVLAFSAFTQTRQKIDELTVERLNIVEKNGQLVAVMANTDRMPDPIVGGKSFKTERPPGMIFYNGLGDECGGLIFGAVKGGDKYGAYGGFTFDQYRQSQAIGFVFKHPTRSRGGGMRGWGR